MKDGIITTEFWTTAISIVGMLWGALSGHLDPSVAAGVTGLVAAVYGLARTWLKAAHAKGQLTDVADLPAAGGAK